MGARGERKSKGSGQSREAKVRVAEGRQDPEWPEAGFPESQECPKSPESEPCVLRTYIVGGVGVKSYILIDGCLWCQLSGGGGGYPNLGVCGGLSA